MWIIVAVGALAAPSAASAYPATSCQDAPQYYTALSIQAPRTVDEHTLHGWKAIARCEVAYVVAAEISSQSLPGTNPLNRLHANVNGHGGFDLGVWRVSTVYPDPYNPHTGNAVYVTARQGRMTITFEDVAAEQ